MSGLLSIAAVAETVTVSGKAVPVYGVSLQGIAHLLATYPQLRAAFTGGGVNLPELQAQAPAAVAAIIAAGVGYPGDAEQEQAAARLPLEAQADLLAAIMRLTIPNGAGALVEKIKALGLLINIGGSPDTAPATNSPKRSKR